MKNICMEEEMAFYNLDKKWNDYVGVQKEVLKALRSVNYFENGEVTNKATGMDIKINAKGIKETLGSGNRFQALPKRMKQYKIATNWFWIHHIDEHKKVPNYSTHPKDGIKRDSELLTKK